jgi:hypothetical protein
VPWALLRGADALDRPTGDVDLLIARGSGPAADRALAGAGFLRLRVWADGGQRFHLGYDERTGTWVHLHVVDRLAFGDHAGLELARAGDDVLARRRRTAAGEWTLDPADELWVTLLHALLDKGGRIKEAHRARLAAIAAPHSTSSPVAQAWRDVGGGDPAAALAQLLAHEWEALEAGAGATRARWLDADPAARQRTKANRRSLRARKAIEPVTMRGLSAALLAPDGGGKSTVARRVAHDFFLDAKVVYLGLYGAANPVVDVPIPGAGMAQRLVRTWARWSVARLHQARRWLVVFDRHPYDARLQHAGGGGAARVRRTILGRAVPPPDLVVVLDAPGQVLFDRKGEHDPERLEAQRQAYLRLAAQLGPRAEIVDATAPEDAVVRAVTAAIWRRYLARQSTAST